MHGAGRAAGLQSSRTRTYAQSNDMILSRIYDTSRMRLAPHPLGLKSCIIPEQRRFSPKTSTNEGGVYNSTQRKCAVRGKIVIEAFPSFRRRVARRLQCVLPVCRENRHGKVVRGGGWVVVLFTYSYRRFLFSYRHILYPSSYYVPGTYRHIIRSSSYFEVLYTYGTYDTVLELARPLPAAEPGGRSECIMLKNMYDVSCTRVSCIPGIKHTQVPGIMLPCALSLFRPRYLVGTPM